MIETPEITSTSAQPAAVVRLVVPRSQIREVMGPGLQEIRTVLDAQGIAAAGAWYTHHFRMDPNVFDFEIGVPVASPVSASGRVQPGELPARTVARTVYQGDYEGLGAAWGELEAWVHVHGYEPAADLWEQYVVGPEAAAGPAGYRTQLNWPTKA